MAKPILDRAEVGIDFPEKFYHGTFGKSSRFDVRRENDGVAITLDRGESEKRHVEFHIHYFLLEDILSSLTDELKDTDSIPREHRKKLLNAARKISDALG